MKNGKKILLIALALVLVASTVLAFTGPGKWVGIKKGQDLAVNVGRAGVSYTDSFYAGTVNVWRQGATGVYHAPKNFEFTQMLVGVKFYDKNWNRIQTVTGAVYVFFDLRAKEQKAFRDNRLSIYYYDTWKGLWTACPTYTINGGARAVCRIRNYGVYGLLFRDP
jgi:hypothetical protein